MKSQDRYQSVTRCVAKTKIAFLSMQEAEAIVAQALFTLTVCICICICFCVKRQEWVLRQQKMVFSLTFAFDGRDQRKTQMQVLSVNKALFVHRIAFAFALTVKHSLVKIVRLLPQAWWG